MTHNYNELERKVKRKARADKRKWAKDLANQAQRVADSKNMRVASLDVFLGSGLISWITNLEELLHIKAASVAKAGSNKKDNKNSIGSHQLSN